MEERIEALQKEIGSLSVDCRANESAQKKLLNVCQMGLGMVATPEEQLWQIIFTPVISTAIETSIDLGIIDILNKASAPMSLSELAKITGAEQLILMRLLRPMCAIHIVIETGLQMYMAGPMCQALGDKRMRSSWTFAFEEVGLCAGSLPGFLKTNGYKNPDDASPGNWQYATKTDLPIFPWLAQRNPAQLTNFFSMMEAYRMGKRSWYEVYPVEDVLLGGFEDAGVEKNGGTANDGPTLFVDVAGATGYDLQAFKRQFSASNGLPGRLVVEDLPDVIDQIKDLDADIVQIKHDFFTPQPVRGEFAEALPSRHSYLRN